MSEKLDFAGFLTVRLEASSAKTLVRVRAMVFERRIGKRKLYWCKVGLFAPHEHKEAQALADRYKMMPKVRATVVPRFQ